jgi:hypothetical protein
MRIEVKRKTFFSLIVIEDSLKEQLLAYQDYVTVTAGVLLQPLLKWIGLHEDD